MTAATSFAAGVALVASLGALALVDEPAKLVLTGWAVVVDGDTIRVDGAAVRLHGIDAPEAAQTCLDVQARPWSCGAASTAHLRATLYRDPMVRCEVREKDRYGRSVATCRNRHGDIGALQVAAGYALDWPKYSRGAYHDEQEAARGAKLGMWSGGFEAPWEWRHSHRRGAP